MFKRFLELPLANRNHKKRKDIKYLNSHLHLYLLPHTGVPFIYYRTLVGDSRPGPVL